ncbi:hypothetical protein Cst_c01860 [Thermoclostridium stercorarium subsp. stercorarium DSM 8532]|jgi:nucleoside phosphorylase|uniref:5'-methylthioadenosine/S-adenosylhomocysteine nucleosidase n=1 Tax=Thermoclostridium stercorarium (strain ATCC 35414 / DSM 8532 / NCIMB 11754) TaxID=1121335 RepID=L7VL65_THES1|nr:hypothetical protein [Thermoclostridium stercorarium]AGC67211.1 hypothetical protein Cst_c01860 [Thermoclostridium stercorarium subsp. stercorarium DSM 8532]AGI38286.1 hypothetical protein Clst_0177 [Thermoclostridium stercorarium subsp. stercorarium DSM 8532]UZQ85802.1 hypothetical protein ODU73_000172 [Thermoclostridium stercorarium]
MDIIGIIGAMDAEIELILHNITVTDEQEYAGFKFLWGNVRARI